MKLARFLFEDASERVWKETSIDLDKVKTISLDRQRQIISFDDSRIVDLGRGSFYKKVTFIVGDNKFPAQYSSIYELYEIILSYWRKDN